MGFTGQLFSRVASAYSSASVARKKNLKSYGFFDLP